MPYWRFEPIARPGDPRWQGRRIYRDVVVAADSPGLAILHASAAHRPTPMPKIGNETLCYRSGFEDHRLYRLRRISEAEAQKRNAGGGDSR
jgi:hypothetical protein